MKEINWSKVSALGVGLLLMSMTLTLAVSSAYAEQGSVALEMPEVDPACTAPIMNQTVSANAGNITADQVLAYMSGSLDMERFLQPERTPRGMPNGGMMAANGLLSVLSDEQLAALVQLAETQTADINQTGVNRIVLAEAFYAVLNGGVSADGASVDLTAVTQYAADLYELEGQILLERAQALGSILSSLDETQVAELESMLSDAGNRSALCAPVDLSDLTMEERMLVMSYAAEMMGWYMGQNAEGNADVQVPDRPQPPEGNMTCARGPGAMFLNVLTDEQKALLSDLVSSQAAYVEEMSSIRENVTAQLSLAMSGSEIDQQTVLDLMNRYGELEGTILYNYAATFAEINSTLTAEQRQMLAAPAPGHDRQGMRGGPQQQMNMRHGQGEAFPANTGNSTATDNVTASVSSTTSQESSGSVFLISAALAAIALVGLAFFVVRRFG
jgi:hypothetical protein